MPTQYQMVNFSVNKSAANLKPKGLNSEELKPLLIEFTSKLCSYLYNLLEPQNHPKAVELLNQIEKQLHRFINNKNLKSSENLTLETISLVTMQISAMKIAATQHLPVDQVFNSVLAQISNKGNDAELMSSAHELIGTVNHYLKPKYPIIVVVEGADLELKNSLVNELSHYFNACVIKGDVQNHLSDQDENILGGVNKALSVLTEQNNMVIINESYLTEFAYSMATGSTSWKGLHRAIHEGLQALNAVFILCNTLNPRGNNEELITNDWFANLDETKDLSDMSQGMMLQNSISYNENSEDFIEKVLLPKLNSVLNQS